MRGFLTIGLALGFGLLGVMHASARGDRRPCDHCGAPGTTTYVRTVHPLLEVTRYHDRSVYHHVTRLHYVVGVTRIQPIIQVHDVTRLHHFTIAHDTYAYEPQQPATFAYVPQSPVNAFGYGGGFGSGGFGGGGGFGYGGACACGD